MTKRCISEKGKEKQLEKELPWGLIPYEERHLYREAEFKQWKEHVEFGAVKALSVEESKKIIETVPKERVLNSRFAYKDKNHAARKAGQDLPCKPKARLAIVILAWGTLTWQWMHQLLPDTASCWLYSWLFPEVG